MASAAPLTSDPNQAFPKDASLVGGRQGRSQSLLDPEHALACAWVVLEPANHGDGVPHGGAGHGLGRTVVGLWSRGGSMYSMYSLHQRDMREYIGLYV